jgi:hypothetical protein
MSNIKPEFFFAFFMLLTKYLSENYVLLWNGLFGFFEMIDIENLPPALIENNVLHEDSW